MQKTILVTGGAGYIGSACVDALLKDGHKVVVFDDLSTGQAHKISEGAELIEGSITDIQVLDKVCSERKFDAVMHFAGKKAVGESEIDPTLYFETNVLGSLNILKVMEKHEIPQIVFSSTAAVYDPFTESEVLTEETATKPISVYGLSKLMAEDLIRTYFRVGKIKEYAILRYFNVAGDAGLNYKEDNAQNVFPVIARAINNDTEFTIFGDDYNTIDGTCVRDYIHLKDLVNAHIQALENESGTYNIGTGSGYSVRQLVNAFNEQLEDPLKVKTVERRPGDAPIVVAKATLAHEKLNWKPENTLDSMVEDTLRVYSA